MSPEYFFRNFATIHTFVILKAHHNDRVRDNDLFTEWLSLGYVGFRVLVEWKFKKPFHFSKNLRNGGQFRNLITKAVQRMGMHLCQFQSCFFA